MGRRWSEKDALEVWQTPKSKMGTLIQKLNRTLGALECVYRVKDEAISGEYSLFYRPSVSNPERYFEEFIKKGVKPVI